MADKTINDLTESTTLAAGDLFEIENAGGNSRKMSAANLAKGLGGWELISAQTASASATIDFTGIDPAAWDELELVALDVVNATDATDLLLRVGTGAGPTWAAGVSDYSWVKRGVYGTTGAGSSFTAADTTSDTMQFPMTGISNVAGETQTARMTVNGLGAGVPCQCRGQGGGWKSDNAHLESTATGRYNSTTAITALRVLASSGNITSGKFILRGRRAA